MPLTAPPSSQETLLQSASHHQSSFILQISTHSNTQLSECDMQEFPAPPRTTHHSPPQDLAYEPKFHVNLPLHPIHTLSTPHYIHSHSCLLYHSEHLSFWFPPAPSPFYHKFIHPLRYSFIVHSLDMSKPLIENANKKKNKYKHV